MEAFKNAIIVLAKQQQNKQHATVPSTASTNSLPPWLCGTAQTTTNYHAKQVPPSLQYLHRVVCNPKLTWLYACNFSVQLVKSIELLYVSLVTMVTVNILV